MSKWSVEAEYRAEVAEEHLEVLSGLVPATVYYNTDDRTLRLQELVDALDIVQITGKVADFFQRVEKHLDSLGITRELLRFGASDAEVPFRYAAGAKEAADMLGVTTTRLRQLESDPAFPQPIAHLAGGRIYRRDEVELYRRSRTPNRGGRPKKAAPEA